MAHRPTRSKHTTLQQVCNLIPPYLVSKLARKHGVDKKARTFTPWSHVVSLLYAQLVHAIGLRATVSRITPPSCSVSATTPPKRNTLSHANKVRDADGRRTWSVLHHLTHINTRFGGRSFGGFPRRFKELSMLSMPPRPLRTVSKSSTQEGGRMHLGLNLQSFLPRFAIIDTARQSDSVRENCAPVWAGAKLFDKAYVDFKPVRARGAGRVLDYDPLSKTAASQTGRQRGTT